MSKKGSVQPDGPTSREEMDVVGDLGTLQEPIVAAVVAPSLISPNFLPRLNPGRGDYFLHCFSSKAPYLGPLFTCTFRGEHLLDKPQDDIMSSSGACFFSSKSL